MERELWARQKIQAGVRILIRFTRHDCALEVDELKRCIKEWDETIFFARVLVHSFSSVDATLWNGVGDPDGDRAFKELKKRLSKCRNCTGCLTRYNEPNDTTTTSESFDEPLPQPASS